MHHNREKSEGGLRRFSFRIRVRTLVVALFCTVGLPLLATAQEPPPDKEYFDIVKSIDLLGEVYREVSKNYVDPINASEFMYAGIDGMLRTLDPYTVFLNEEDAGELDEQTSGQYVGVGITIASLDGMFFVTSVTEGHSAAKAGIKVGDSIVAINNKETRKTLPEEVRGEIKGPAGSRVTLQLERKGVPLFTVVLVREDVRVNTVSYSGIIDGVGYIEMKSFGTHSAVELREALQALIKQAQERRIALKGVILDLRNNPGGLLNAAVDVASVFLNQGSKVVSLQGRLPEMTKSYLTEERPLASELPLALLINAHSASASEIVSGVVQDLDRGVVIGERSFGKGLVQSVVRISYDSSVKLTIAKYYTPSGRLIQKEVKPMSSSRKVLSRDRGDTSSQSFFTKGGRKVYGGGGISPDIEMSEPAGSFYLTELRRKGMLFLFATEFCSAYPIKPPLPLEPLQLLASFNDFLTKRKFVYIPDTERRFNDLKESIKRAEPEISESRLKSFDVIQQDLDRLKNREIAREDSDVAKSLEVEIFRHYNSQLARGAELNNDKVVKKAVEVLSDRAKYSSILQPAVPVN